MNAIISLTPHQLRQAADIQERIQSLQHELTRLLGQQVTAPSTPPTRKRRMSAAGRAAIAAAARARWAKIKGNTSPAKPAVKPKRKVSAAARARLSAMAKARWKKAKAAGKTAL